MNPASVLYSSLETQDLLVRSPAEHVAAPEE